MNSKAVTYISVLISMIFWGMSFIWTNMLLQTGYPPVSIVLVRLVIVSVLLYMVSKITGKLQKVEKQDFKFFLLMAAFEPFLYFIFETYGLQLTQSPTLVSVIVSTIPLFSPIVGYYFYRERISINNFIGIMLSIIGVCMVIFHKGEAIDGNFLGITLLFGAVLSAIFYASVIKKLADRYNSFTLVTYQSIIGIVYFLPIFFLFEKEQFFNVPFSLASAYPFIMLAVFASGVAFVLFINVIRELGVTKANIFTTLIPVLTAVFSFLIYNERVTVLRGVGICVVATGLILSQLKVKAKQA